MKYGKRWSLLERWDMDSQSLAGKSFDLPPENLATGETIRLGVVAFAEDFLNMSSSELENLPGEKFHAIVELEGFFGDISNDILEKIYEDGLGESFDEMFEKAAGGLVFPKLAREFVEKQLGPWDEWIPLKGYMGEELRSSAYAEKYGPLWPGYHDD